MRMLLSTAALAAVVALFAGGANAMIPNDEGEVIRAQAYSGIGVDAAQPPSWRGKGGKGEETGGATNPLQQTGVIAATYKFPECSLGLCHFDELLAARLGLATRAGSAPTYSFPPGYRGLP